MKTHVSLAAGVLAAIGATACCFGPLLLVSLGLGGAWMVRMRGLDSFQPIFAGLTLLFVGFAFHRLYVQPRGCAPGEACEAPQVLRRQRMAFWAVVAAIAAVAIFPMVSGYFL
jgi:mercuric ion transport protein